jgi:hypothetical protein
MTRLEQEKFWSETKKYWQDNYDWAADRGLGDLIKIAADAIAICNEELNRISLLA